MRRKVILTGAIIFFSAVMLFAGWNLYKQVAEYRSGEEAYEELEQYVEIPTLNPTPTPTQSSDDQSVENESDETEPKDEIAWPTVDFDALLAVNPDVVGWIYIEGTTINYPIVQGDDNDYYLKHLLDGSYNSAGAIFMEYRNEPDFSDRNTIIYGHHMKNNTMFSELDGYKTQEFYDSHPTVLILTPETNYAVELFSGYVASVEDNAWELGFTASAYSDWLAATKERSCFSSPVIPDADDRVVTLSTCSYEFSNARFVMVGVLQEYDR